MRLCRARDQLRDIGHAEMSIDEIATMAAMSRFHFIRQFKAVFGDTPVRFRTRMRLEMAQHLLVTSDRSVTDICMAVGYSSLGSFSTLFARRFGRSPAEYRRILAGSAEGPSPDCMLLLRAAWEHESQLSRSQA